MTMLLFDGLPDGPARQHVTRYVGYEEASGLPLRRREVPGASVSLILSLGPQMRVTSTLRDETQTLRSFFVGLHQCHTFTEHDGTQAGIQVDITPTGAFSLLGVPMHELASRTVPVDVLLERWAGELQDELAYAHSWDDRIAIVDRAVNRAIASGPSPAPEVEWAWCELQRRGGRGTVGDLAGAVGWSARHLNERFREQVGATPKMVARLLRFQRATRMLVDQSRPAASPADVAHACGYFDQAHLNREFREFAGCTPLEYRQEELAPSTA